ncbi:hypothetical protein RHGRI_018257 [Rhododendron griersonianum]|uniref:Ribokinase n=1 Tax=Rhododendron griersonianum TaxID=479676 RepID=A0AAV6K0R0_9ERIC|nr:hypothetical protein RHGRI_018257 [Rhododendron griersonianum]
MRGIAALSPSKHFNATPQTNPKTQPIQSNNNHFSPKPNKPSFPSFSTTPSKTPIPIPTPPLVVVGSANADIYVEIERLPKEGETISAAHSQTLAGGKGANQAVCGGKLSYPTYFVGQVGQDAHGKLVTEALEGGGVHLDYVNTVSAAPTGHAVVMLQSDGQNSIIIVGGANMSCWPDCMSDDDLELVRSAGIVLLQREIPDFVNVQVAKAAKTAGVPVILDAGGVDAPIPSELLNFVDILSPNESELARLTGMPTESFEQISRAVIKCHEMVSSETTTNLDHPNLLSTRDVYIQGVKQVLVKLGAKGSALFIEGEEPIKQPIISAPRVLDTTGAGDTFTAAFAVALVEGKSKTECLRFAAAAASLCVQVMGAIPSMPDRKSVLNLLQSL